MTTEQIVQGETLRPVVGTLTAVAVVHKVSPITWDDPPSTAIDKRAIEGRVPLHGLGLAGDVQCNRKHHGGPLVALLGGI